MENPKLPRETYSRMMGLASIKAMKALDTSLTTLFNDWLEEGFDKEDCEMFIRIKICEALPSFTNEVLQHNEKPNEPIEVIDTNSKLTRYGTEVMANNGVKLGDIVKTKEALKIGNKYCIVDLGTNEWIPDFRYEGLNLGPGEHPYYTFKNTLDTHALGEDDMYNQTEMAEMLENNQVRHQLPLSPEELKTLEGQ